MQELTTNHHLQVFIFTNFEDLVDLQTDIVGPFEPPEFITTIDKFLNEDRWSRKVADPQFWIFKDGILDKPLPGEEYIFSSFIAKILAKAYELYGEKVPFTIYDNHFWITYERFQDKDIEALIESTLIIPEEPAVSESTIKINIIECRYTYFYPACWIGPKPVVEFKDRLTNVPASNYVKTYTNKLKDKLVVFNSNGFIALESEDWEETLKLINLFMAVISISGRELMSAGRWDLFAIKYEEYKPKKYRKKTQKFLEITARSSIREEISRSIAEYLREERIIIPLNEFHYYLRITEMLYENDIFTKSMLFHFESLTEYSRDKYPQALILSWITIERYINVLWQDYLKKSSFEKNRLDFLNDVRTWTAASRAELLNAIGLINDNDYESITKYRKARNAFVHEKKGFVINQELALECLEFTRYLVFKIIGESESELIKGWIQKFKFIT